ncbi:hypothetical protein [Nocardia implantans]|uniref:Lantibiotic dehydratase N-terminal domain-containing protein n=1 Tax=Nocardia implantans TaxID=3108168 RepID=A0ABU6AMI5_9NOCA|nr:MULTISPECIES: hypothetical protein [unclassified Nocardia]MBF6193595.1 hypothetical protein [Nocardia beijingensis]MEA3532204.1 hypothetical protein [Nocardia sp. CDC192]MEB3508695.1 hypothetical protein [Nocardia sp. CDC186]
MVLDEVWRKLEGVEPLSGPHGGPLRRTVKLVLDPLVIRPVQHPSCAGPILTADGAVLLEARIQAAADVLRATAAWFTVLKQVRRTLRITEGHPQDLYFQRCFELATTSGMPDAARARAVAEDALREIHEYTAGRTTQALKEYLTDHTRERELAGLLDLAWRRRPLTGPAGADHDAEVRELLEACAAARLGEDADRQPTLGRLVAAHAGTHTGIRLWQEESAQELGLTAHPVPLRPAIGSSASKSTLGLPFDRSVYERVFTVLQASTERAELPPIPELVDAEIARSCAPWALLDESLRVTATAGAALATGLAPIEHRRGPSTGRPRLRLAGTGTTPSRAHQLVNSRWQREAYVLQARRLVVSAEPPTGPLAAIAAELITPWQPYLRRLWVRLHGRDVREYAIHDPDELWDLLDGVARSVILDHRTRVKRALSVRAGAGEPDAAESKAS